ncbi:MAG: ComEC/Rec2 family competence protein [Muribaculaceae bacterium]|nr:ComEC/Rec2 family competence protein [Muribaculaceae bacterium]
MFKRQLFILSAYFSVVIIGFVISLFHNETEFKPVKDKEYTVRAKIERRRTLTNCEMYNLHILTVDDVKCKDNTILFASAKEVFNPGEEIMFSSQLYEKTSDSIKKSISLSNSSTLIASTTIKGNAIKVKNAGPVRQLFNELSSSIVIAIEKSGLSKDTQGILKALIIGDRSSLSKDKISLFRDAGVIHILALSGMHIGIIAGIIMWLTLPLNLLSYRKYRYVIVIITVWFFVLLTGSAYSTIRAGIMITLTMVAMILDRPRDAFSICCFSAFFMIIIWPDVITDIGFQLSFLSVMMLTLLADPLNPIPHRQNPKLFRIYSIIISTFIATGITWILSAYHFGSAPVSFLPANIIILPILPFYLVACIVYLLLALIGVEFYAFRLILDSFPELAYKFLAVAGMPQLEIKVGWITLSLWLLAFLSLSISVRKLRNKYVVAGSMNRPVQNVDLKWILVAGICLTASLILIPYQI